MKLCLYKVHKAVNYFTDTCDLKDAGELFKNTCHGYDKHQCCDAQHLCDKIHFNSYDQKIIIQIVEVLIKWDKLPINLESRLGLTPCRFQDKCNHGSCCSFLHTDDIIQKLALDLRYNYNCSFKWVF